MEEKLAATPVCVYYHSKFVPIIHAYVFIGVLVARCHGGVKVNCMNASNCEYSASWTVIGDSINFELRARNSEWIAIGFSDDQRMVRHNF